MLLMFYSTLGLKIEGFVSEPVVVVVVCCSYNIQEVAKGVSYFYMLTNCHLCFLGNGTQKRSKPLGKWKGS
jgi:hypothetical protein